LQAVVEAVVLVPAQVVAEQEVLDLILVLV